VQYTFIFYITMQICYLRRQMRIGHEPFVIVLWFVLPFPVVGIRLTVWEEILPMPNSGTIADKEKNQKNKHSFSTPPCYYEKRAPMPSSTNAKWTAATGAPAVAAITSISYLVWPSMTDAIPRSWSISTTNMAMHGGLQSLIVDQYRVRVGSTDVL
jgi:hypothetical protein